jgi:hypothetical protein
VVAEANGSGNAVVAEPARSKWTTSMECVSADGKVIDPLLIFAGENVQSNWIPRHLDTRGCQNWKFTCTSNGWTSNDIGADWISEVFEPQTRPAGRRTWRLLIMDNHGSHCTIKFMRTCLEHQIMLLYIPPHTSHVLQPLDVGCFSAAKAAYRRSLSILPGIYSKEHVSKEQCVDLYINARIAGLEKSNIRSGWKKSGLWPINIAKPLDTKFVKDVAAREAPIERPPLRNITNLPSTLLNLDERGARVVQLVHGRDLKTKDAQIAMLTAQLKQTENRLALCESKNKRKRVQNEDSNEKLISVKSVLGTQALAEREQEEELKRHERKVKRAENAAKKAAKQLERLSR